MSHTPDLPLLLAPEQLARRLDTPGLLIVDLSRADLHQQFHIPGAVPLDYAALVAARPPVAGLVPDNHSLTRLFSALGLRPETHVVAYDDEGGGKAARLLWTLALCGHRNYSLLDGGLHAWSEARLPLTREATALQPGHYEAHVDRRSPELATRDTILASLDKPDHALLDVRSPGEYSGIQRYSARGGHIPGAVNIEWSEFMDQNRALRLKPEPQMRKLLEENGVVPGKKVTVYCQTNHRSAHSWFVLKLLGYQVAAYEGSWSDWGNSDELPVET